MRIKIDSLNVPINWKNPSWAERREKGGKGPLVSKASPESTAAAKRQEENRTKSRIVILFPKEEGTMRRKKTNIPFILFLFSLPFPFSLFLKCEVIS